MTTQQKKLIEAALYVAGNDGLSTSELALLLDVDKKQVKEIMLALAAYHNNNEESPFQISDFNNHFKMLTKPDLNSQLIKLAKIRYKNPLTKSLMIILTLIAYNGPITKKQLEKMKPGFNKIKVAENGAVDLDEATSCDYAINRLRELELIESVILDEPGKPYGYKITGKFLDVFGLKSIHDLPKLNENKENK